MRNDILSPKQAEILTALAEGASVSSAAAAAGIHRTTIHHWCRVFPQFRIALKEAKTARAEAILDQICDISPLAVSSLRTILEDQQTPVHLRLKAALAVIRTATITQPEEHLDPAANRSSKEHDLFFDAVYKAAQEEAAAAQERAEERAAAEPPIHQNSSEFITNQKSEAPPAPRNAPCPCGSREKYKRCCGRTAPPSPQQRRLKTNQPQCTKTAAHP